MKFLRTLFLISLLISLAFCQGEIEAKEFEENEITSEFQKFTFKTYNSSKIILIAENPNFNVNSYDKTTLKFINNLTLETAEYNLKDITYCILDIAKKEENIDYILKFKNYLGGKFIIFNSDNIYPLKQFEKGFTLMHYYPINVNLNFNSEILEKDIPLDIYPGNNFKIKKITEIGYEFLEIKNNFIELPKGFKYIIEYNKDNENDEISIKKREIIIDKKAKLKLNIYNRIPYFFLVKPNDYENEIIYSYLYNIDSVSYNFEMAEIESENIDNWNQIEFVGYKAMDTGNAYKIDKSNIKKNYILIKIFAYRRMQKENSYSFYSFKIFENFYDYLHTAKSTKEVLIIYKWSSNLIFINSNITNLKTFENEEIKSQIYQKKSEYFSFIIIPTEIQYELNDIRLTSLTCEIFYKEKTFNNFFNSLYNTMNKVLWYFDINNNYTLFIKYFSGFPQIYYTEIINDEIMNEMKEEKFDKFKKLNESNNILNFNKPFFLYIEPNGNPYLNFLLNKDSILNINEEISSKYLIENKEYILSAPSKLLVKLNEDFDSRVNIYKEGNIISILNKENPFYFINELNHDLIFISNTNAVINFYYHISDMFYNEHFKIIVFSKSINKQIMVVKILSHESDSYYYAMDFGYDFHISIDTKKILTNQIYFFIEDPYNNTDNNLNYYLILFDKNINYEITYINKYEKINNSFYYKINGTQNLALISDNNYLNGYTTYEILLCENENVNITITNINNETEKLTTKKTLINELNRRSIFYFESKSDFIFIQKENYGYKMSETEIKFYIPKIEEGIISILLSNTLLWQNKNNKYSFLLVEDNDKDNNLMNKLDNECYLFSLINGEINNINYDIQNESVDDGRFLYKEINYNVKFSKSKYLLIKIFSCENKKDICIFSKTERIYLENLKKEEQEEFGIKNIEEFIEYNITRKEYIFSYNYNNYLDKIEDIIIYITVPTTGNVYIGQFEVITPLMESFIFKYRYTESIPLIKGQHLKSYGKYYFIFRDCIGVTFYLHNTMHFFPLNKINNYISDTNHLISNSDNLFYFTMELEEDKYIYMEWNVANLYLYSIKNKTTESKNNIMYHTHKINKGSYLIILEYKSYSDNYYIMINLNHFIVELEKNKEIKVEMGTNRITEPTVAAVVDLSKYNNKLFIVSDSKYGRVISCEKSLNIEDIIQNNWSGYTHFRSHIVNIYDQKKCDPPFYNIKLYTSRFEVVTEIYEVNESQNFNFKQSDTVAFTVKGEGYNIIFSNHENLKWLDKMETEFNNIIINNEQIQFKLKPNEKEETQLRIKILENKDNIILNSLFNKEISNRIKYNNDNEEINYYINLSKQKYIINHFDYLGKLEFYVSKEEINENNIEEILKTKNINLNLFDLINENKFDLNLNKILLIKKEKNINSELLMTPLVHDFIIENSNSKYLIANKTYFIRSYIKIYLEDNSDSQIIIYDLNNTEIYKINKTNQIFENFNYNKKIFLKSDKDCLIYIFHKIKENSRLFVHQKNNSNNILVLFASDCENNELNYISDFGSENYMPLNLELRELSDNQISINSIINDEIKIQNDINYITYMECKNNLIGNSSSFFKNSTANEGSILIEKNEKMFIHNILDNDKNNIFYQIFECNNITENEIFISIDNKNLEKLNNKNSFVNGENEVTFYFKTKEELIFNYYKTSSNKYDYDYLEKNENYYFNIHTISSNKFKIDILPAYKNIDFEFYLIIFLDKEKIIIENPLKNKCYIKQLIANNINAENIIIKKIEYKNGDIINNIIDLPNLEKGNRFYSNILGIGKILDNIEEYIFYEEQTFIIEDSDQEKEEEGEKKNNPLSVGAIFGIAVGGFIIIIILMFMIFRCRKKDSIKLEENNTVFPLIS